jgi:hypothetical protein
MEQYIALGAALRREASLDLCALPPSPRWETRTGILTRLWRKGWQTMRVPRLAFAALVLLTLITIGAEWKRVRVGAESNGSVVLVTVQREDKSVFSSYALPLDGSNNGYHSMGGVLDPPKKIEASISIRLAGRVEGGVRLLVKVKAGPITDEIAKADTDDFAQLPEREMILKPGEPLKVAMGDYGTLTLNGEWFDHVPAELGIGIKSIDPGPSELRIYQPVLLKGDMRIGELDGNAHNSGFNTSVGLVFPKTGRYLFSLLPIPEAVEGKIDRNRISFEYQGTPYTLLTAAGISRQENVWVKVEPEYKDPDHPGSYGFGFVRNATLTQKK